MEQQHIVQLFRSIGGRAYVLGTRRRRGDYQGTMQTPGVPDVIAFLPPLREPELVFVECKATGGRLRLEQQEFQGLCERGHVAHIVGGLNAVIAWLIAAGRLAPSNVAHYRRPEDAGLHICKQPGFDPAVHCCLGCQSKETRA